MLTSLPGISFIPSNPQNQAGATLDLLGDGRVTDHLLKLLRTALGGVQEVEIRW
jgi:hypothetical protein